MAEMRPKDRGDAPISFIMRGDVDMSVMTDDDILKLHDKIAEALMGLGVNSCGHAIVS